MIDLIRLTLALPVIVLGSLILRLAEFIAGHKMTFRGDEVLEMKKTNAECSQCGHKGALFNMPPDYKRANKS